MPRALLMGSFAWLLAGLPAYAQSPSEVGEHGNSTVAIYTKWRKYTTEEGLPSNRVRCLYGHADRVWIGTNTGLAMFDGEHFVQWGKQDGLPDYPVEAIRTDPNTGDLWIATFGGGLVRMSGGRFFVLNQLNSGLAGNLVFDIETTDGEVWAASNGGLEAYRPETDGWRLCNARTKGKWPVITDLVAIDDRLRGLVWKQGVVEVKSADAGCVPRWSSMLPRPGIVAMDFTDSTLWTSGNDLVHSSQNGSTDVVGTDWLAENELPTAIASTGSEAVWLGTTQSLHQVSADGRTSAMYRRASGKTEVVLHGDGEEVYDVAGEGPLGPIRAIAQGEREIWIATDHGLFLGTDPVGLAEIRRRPHQPIPSGKRAPITLGERAEGDRATIAVYGPRNRTITIPGDEDAAPEPRPDVLALEVAVSLENSHSSGSSRITFETTIVPPGYIDYGWSLPEDDTFLFERNPSVVGIIGHIGENDSITDAVTFRGQLPWVNSAPISESAGVVSACGNPNTFRCFGDLPRQHRAVLDYAVKVAAAKRIAFLAASDAVSSRHIGWWKDYAQSKRLEVVNDASDSSDADVVFIWGDSDFTLSTIRGLRKQGMSGLVITAPAILSSSGLSISGLGRVIAFVPDLSPADRTLIHADFISAYRAQSSESGTARSDEESFASLHAANHLMHAVKLAGPDRAAVGKVLAILESSCFGEDHFERMHAPRPVSIAELREGVWRRRQIPPQ